MKLTVNGVTVRYYRCDTGDNQYWEIRYHEAGKNVRLKHDDQGAFKSEKRAAAAANLIAQRLSGGFLTPTSAQDSEAIQYLRRELPGVPIQNIIASYKQQHAGFTSRSIPDMVAEMLEEKRSAGLSREYISNLAVRFGRFTRSFSGRMDAVTGPQLSEWFTKAKFAGRNRNNYLQAIQTLVKWAKRKKYLPATWDALDAVHRAKIVYGAVEIFTPEEMRQLLDHANPIHIPFLTIAAFSAIRTTEILRLDWSRVGEKWITLGADITKLSARRLAPIPPNLSQWLAPYRKSTGPVYDAGIKGAAHAVLRLAQRAGIPWKRNALRHSGISYRLAQTNDIKLISIESGNSPEIIERNYRELVTPESAVNWFSILPTSENVTTLSQPVSSETPK